MFYATFPDEIMTRCLQGIREFQQQHSDKNPSWIFFPCEFASIIEGVPLGSDIGQEVLINGARSITRARLEEIELTIFWDADEFKVSDQEPSNMDRLRAALNVGQRVEISRHVGAASGTLSVARENAERAAEANARGERVARIMDKNGKRKRKFECGVNADEARELLARGALEV